MKITNSNRATLALRLRACRKAGAFAVLSLSTLSALAAIEKRHASRVTRETMSRAHTRADESPEDAEIGASNLFAADEADAQIGESATLNRAERDALNRARPGSRAVIFRAAPVAAPEEAIPEGFTPEIVPAYVPALDSLDAAELALADAEGQAEAKIALAALDAEIAAIPAPAPVAVAPVTPAPVKVRSVAARMATPAPASYSFAALAARMLRAAS